VKLVRIVRRVMTDVVHMYVTTGENYGIRVMTDNDWGNSINSDLCARLANA
jgi:hypothetical protein